VLERQSRRQGARGDFGFFKLQRSDLSVATQFKRKSKLLRSDTNRRDAIQANPIYLAPVLRSYRLGLETLCPLCGAWKAKPNGQGAVKKKTGGPR
jgi:hypothetical protein